MHGTPTRLARHPSITASPRLRTSKRRSFTVPLRNLLFTVVTCTFTLVLLLAARVTLFAHHTRTCRPSWVTAAERAERPRIAVVTRADTRRTVPPRTVTRRLGIAPVKEAVDILELTWPQKQQYCHLHGYALLNVTEDHEPARPPSWSKLLGVSRRLAEYDWIMWLDADTVITNERIALETLLPATGGPDFVLTRDPGGYNAGIWMMRRSDWTRRFLQTWWDSTSFIRAAGDSKSGDNDALKALLASMPAAEHARSVGVAPQCAFNSYVWRTSARTVLRYLWDPVGSTAGLWRRGDFIAHLAGFRDKHSAIAELKLVGAGRAGARHAAAASAH